jgi:hypothetical protein
VDWRELGNTCEERGVLGRIAGRTLSEKRREKEKKRGRET